MAQILTLEDAVRVGVVLGASAVITVSARAERRSTASGTVNVSEQTLSSHPLVSLLGKYRDEPLWDGFEEALRTIRDEDEAQP